MRVHSQVKDYNCELCNSAFSHKSSFDRHKEAVHLKMNIHKCEECGRGFFLQHSMKRHYDNILVKKSSVSAKNIQ